MKYAYKFIKYPILLKNLKYIFREVSRMKGNFLELPELTELAFFMGMIVRKKGLKLDKNYNKFMQVAKKTNWHVLINDEIYTCAKSGYYINDNTGK